MCSSDLWSDDNHNRVMIQDSSIYEGRECLQIKNIISGRCEITSQNHGFSVKEDDIKNSKVVEVTHINLNDKTIEGIRVKDRMAFSVQYHPESAPGPHDSTYLFDEFTEAIKRVTVGA